MSSLLHIHRIRLPARQPARQLASQSVSERVRQAVLPASAGKARQAVASIKAALQGGVSGEDLSMALTVLLLSGDVTSQKPPLALLSSLQCQPAGRSWNNWLLTRTVGPKVRLFSSEFVTDSKIPSLINSAFDTLGRKSSEIT